MTPSGVSIGRSLGTGAGTGTGCGGMLIFADPER